MNDDETPVDWLVEQYANENYSIEVYQQATEMEKKLMAEKYDEGYGDGYHQALKDLEMHNMIWKTNKQH